MGTRLVLVLRQAVDLTGMRSILFTVAAVAALLGAIWGTVILDAKERDEQAMLAVQRANANLATVMAEHTKRTLLALDQIANLAKARYEELGPKFDADRFIREVGFDGGLVLALIIVDENGERVTASDGINAISMADRAYFQQHRAQKLGHSIIAPPLFGRLKPRWVLPVSWRLDKPDGSFGGMISMGINPYYFTEIYRRIDLGRKGMISLIGSDGIVRVRLSDDETTFGQNVVGSAVLAGSMRNGRGSVVHRAIVDGVTRLYSYERVAGYPLHVSIGSAVESVLAASRAERAEDYQQAVRATVAIVVLALLLGIVKWRKRRSDRALEVAQSRQQAIFDSIADPAWLLDAEGRFVAVNRAFEEVFGARFDDLAEATQPNIFANACVAQQSDCPCKLGRPCAGRRCELRLSRGNEEIWLETATVPIQGSGGVSGTAGTARDITMRKRLERELKESHARLNLALSHAAMAVWEWNVDSDALIHTEGMPALLANPTPAAIATRALWLGHVHAADRGTVQTALAECLRGASEYNAEYRVQGLDGRLRWVHDRGAITIRRPDGSAGVLSGVVYDISVRKAAELAQRESEQRFRVLVETMDDIFWIASPDLGAIHYVSPGFRRTLGVEPDVLYAEPGRWRRFVHPEDLPLAQSFLERQQRAEPAVCELRMPHVSGAYRWMLVRSLPWRDAHGTLLVAGMVEDITERKQASEQRLRDAERQRDALVMEVHHRIKNNLQGVLGLLDEHKPADPLTRSLLRSVATRIQSVATVHGLQGRRTGSAILLTELVRAIADNARGLGDARIELSIRCGHGDFQIKERESVPVALILNELIWNAIKHSTEMPRTAHVTIADGRGGAVAVEVRNRGRLSDAEDARSLSSGAGLGLIRALMPPHGARLTHRTDEGTVLAVLVLSAPVLESERLNTAA